uniref:Uncharacterized protein n=1 Tax=Arundo donax TaxID=35708 RepID=A0A0A9FZ01_ARUDO
MPPILAIWKMTPSESRWHGSSTDTLYRNALALLNKCQSMSFVILYFISPLCFDLIRQTLLPSLDDVIFGYFACLFLC